MYTVVTDMYYFNKLITDVTHPPLKTRMIVG